MQYAAAKPLAPSIAPVIEKGTRLLFRLAVAVLLLNLLDGVLTLALVSSGLATEANPLMAQALGQSAFHFMAFKISLVSLSVLLCWRLRERRIACLAIYAAAATYGLLGIYHIKSIDLLARFIS